jgi:carboxylesterase type B
MAKSSSSVLVLIAGLLVVSCALLAQATHDPTLVRVKDGWVRGVDLGDTSIAFLGIPFAAPPVGNLRFAKPVRPQPWQGILNATAWAPMCIQTSGSSTNSAPNLPLSEDCLYLNVYVPKGLQGPLPVSVYIHGGRYWTGRATENDGQYLAKKGKTIVVTVAYRLNIFGFAATDSLAAGGATNLGLQDQVLALKWVVRNIPSFGGNPFDVMLFGESAGAGSVLNHLLMPQSTGLFQKAILQSTWQWRIPTLSQTVNATLAVAQKWACDMTSEATVLACLRSLNTSQLLPNTSGSNYFQPTVDGRYVFGQPLQRVSEGKFNRLVAITLGTDAVEGNFMAYSRCGFKPPSEVCPDTNYDNAFNNALLPFLSADQVATIKSWYEPLRAQVGNWHTMSQFLGDFYIYCGSFESAKYFDRYALRPVYAYWFDHLSVNDPEPYLGATHGNELDFVFNATVYLPSYPFDAADRFVSDLLMTAWGDIADIGRPKTPGWTSYHRQDPQAFVIKSTYPPGQNTVPFDSALCANWKSVLLQD